ncbi:ATP-binding protein [Tenggerimyces flavus]|uniref:ATP-binding protein n=1 Tax=Tenggerimyces flavus TaxID=1708749 RepID=A0ABV7YBR9_9ACTN
MDAAAVLEPVPEPELILAASSSNSSSIRRCSRPRPRTTLYLDAGQLVVLLGDSGIGRTHLLIARAWPPATKAATSATSPARKLAIELVEAADDRMPSCVVARYGHLDLLLLDELGYVQVDPRGPELLLQIITEREERASIGIVDPLRAGHIVEVDVRVLLRIRPQSAAAVPGRPRWCRVERGLPRPGMTARVYVPRLQDQSERVRR